MRLALTASDADALAAVRSAIVGGRGASMTAVLRACGDTTPTGWLGRRVSGRVSAGDRHRRVNRPPG